MNPKIKLIFFGTPDIAAKCLESLMADDAFEILAVVTQEDKPVGRRQVMTPSAVKVYAESEGLPVYQPTNISEDIFLYEKLILLKPDYNVVVAYGQIMSQNWLDLPRISSVNLHVSLLPKYRGASPMQEALKHGDKSTGVTIQKMAYKMDTGDILAQEEFGIEPDDTFLEIYEKAGSIGARLLVETLKSDFDPTSDHGRLTGAVQDASKASYCTKITKQDGLIDFAIMTADEIYNKYRAYKVWPGIYSFWNDKRVKLTEIIISDEVALDIAPGTWGTDKDRLFVKSKDSVIEVLRCQLEGKKEMAVADVLRGI